MIVVLLLVLLVPTGLFGQQAGEGLPSNGFDIPAASAGDGDAADDASDQAPAQTESRASSWWCWWS